MKIKRHIFIGIALLLVFYSIDVNGKEYGRNSVKGLVKYPLINELELSDIYSLKIDTTEIECYKTYRFNKENPIKKIKGRPVSNLHFAMFDFNQNANITLTLSDKVKINPEKIRILPSYLGIVPKIIDNKISFKLNKPQNLTLALDDLGNEAFHLFTNYPETYIPSMDDPNVVYFGPGVHEVESIFLKEGQTLYLAPGAFLKFLPKGTGKFAKVNGINFEIAEHAITMASNTKIIGRGIISGIKSYISDKRFKMINISDVENVRINDILIMDGSAWVCSTFGASNCIFENLKIIGFFNNTDGICFSSSKNCVAKKCFVHSADDGLEVKASVPGFTHNVLFEDCQVWTDAGGPLGVTENNPYDINDVIWKNISVLFYTAPLPSSKYEGRGVFTLSCPAGGKVENLKFENINIENMTSGKPVINMFNVKKGWSGVPKYTDKPFSEIVNVDFKNISVRTLSNSYPKEIIMYDVSPSKKLIKGISIKNMIINGTKISKDNVNDYVDLLGDIDWVVK